MKTNQHTTYECEKCGSVYDTMKAAIECEAKPLPEATFGVGDFVGVGTPYGWWSADTSWTLSQPRIRDSWNLSKKKWAKSPPGPFDPGHRMFLVLYMVVATRAVPREHRLQILLWTPRHANRIRKNEQGVSEDLSCTYSSGHYTPLAIPVALRPSLTAEERNRFSHLVLSPPWNKANLV